MRRDIDEALHGWPYDPEPGEVVAREVRARDGRMVLQIRLDLGVLQLEAEGRPDGTRPHGFATYLEYLRHRAASRAAASSKEPWTMEPVHCLEADREFAQYYHRRVAWLALQRYDRALRDADHTLALMDFVALHGPEGDYIESHERFRGPVIFQRTQALVALAIERGKGEEAVDAVHDGVARLSEHQESWSLDREDDDAINEALIEQLRALEGEIRKNFSVSKTLKEQLDEAVATEDYERAARIRDLIKLRGGANR